MSKLTPEAIADYRYQLIAPIVSKNCMAHGEHAKIIRSISTGTYEGVDYRHGLTSERMYYYDKNSVVPVWSFSQGKSKDILMINAVNNEFIYR